MGEKSSGKRLVIGRLLLITFHSALVTALIPLAGFTADRELELQPHIEAANPHPAPKVQKV
jgi:hypothetical protein